ncbi:MAG: DNA-formamidopyrimidine glycosylase, partial [Actinomycetota bacterium]|nr:DNA-formamidopyrimidine glycosylase [Actinomycetota bacterium]
MQIVARRLAPALFGEKIESVLAPGINAVKTFDPPLQALDRGQFTGVRRRGKV